MRLPVGARAIVASCDTRYRGACHSDGMAHNLDTMAKRIAWAVTRYEGTHQDIAVAVGVQRPMISMWCGGSRTPELGNLQALADVLGVSAAWLLSGDRVALRDAGEADFIDIFRDLAPDQRATVAQIAAALSKLPAA